MDADDYFDSDRLRILMRGLSSHRGLMIADDSVIFSDSSEEVLSTVFTQQGIVFDSTGEVLLDLDGYFQRGTPNIKIVFPSQWVKERSICYDNNIKFGEDLKFLIDLFASGLQLKLISSGSYFYRMNFSSITRSSNKPWDHLSAVHAYASNIFASRGSVELAAREKNTSIKYLAFYRIKNRKFFDLLFMIIQSPSTIGVLYRGISETIYLRYKQGRYDLWRTRKR